MEKIVKFTILRSIILANSMQLIIFDVEFRHSSKFRLE